MQNFIDLTDADDEMCPESLPSDCQRQLLEAAAPEDLIAALKAQGLSESEDEVSETPAPKGDRCNPKELYSLSPASDNRAPAKLQVTRVDVLAEIGQSKGDRSHHALSAKKLVEAFKAKGLSPKEALVSLKANVVGGAMSLENECPIELKPNADSNISTPAIQPERKSEESGNDNVPLQQRIDALIKSASSNAGSLEDEQQKCNATPPSASSKGESPSDKNTVAGESSEKLKKVPPPPPPVVLPLATNFAAFSPGTPGKSTAQLLMEWTARQGAEKHSQDSPPVNLGTPSLAVPTQLGVNFLTVLAKAGLMPNYTVPPPPPCTPPPPASVPGERDESNGFAKAKAAECTPPLPASVSGKDEKSNDLAKGKIPEGAQPEPSSVSGKGEKSNDFSKGQTVEYAIFIGNLTHDISEDELHALFSTVGCIKQLRYVKGKCFALCVFANKDEAYNAIEKFHGFDLRGRKLRVMISDRTLQVMKAMTTKEMAHKATKEMAHKEAKSVIDEAAQAQQVGAPVALLDTEMLEQIKTRIKSVRTTVEKPCHLGRSCKIIDCPKQHKEGRDIENDPLVVLCKSGRGCKRRHCFYVHMAGRLEDEDPLKGACSLGRECVDPQCSCVHPENRRSVSISNLQCNRCRELGHTQKHCTKWVPRVHLNAFSVDWQQSSGVDLLARVTVALEAFGDLEGPPRLLEQGAKVEAVFKDRKAAEDAITNLNSSESFHIEFCNPPPILHKPFEFEVEGFPCNWLAENVKDHIRALAKGKPITCTVEMLAVDKAASPRAKVHMSSQSDAEHILPGLLETKVDDRQVIVFVGGVAINRAPAKPELPSGKQYKNIRNHTPLRCIHIDELNIVNRLHLNARKSDCEVWVDPLPRREIAQERFSRFGEVDEIFHIVDVSVNEPLEKGYVTFKAHSAAAQCVSESLGRWSESERILSSQSSPHSSAYSCNMISKIIGSRGDNIKDLKEDIGAFGLFLRGKGISAEACKDKFLEKTQSSRLHFLCQGSDDAFAKLKPALERLINKIHCELQSNLSQSDKPWKPPPLANAGITSPMLHPPFYHPPPVWHPFPGWRPPLPWHVPVPSGVEGSAWGVPSQRDHKKRKNDDIHIDENEQHRQRRRRRHKHKSDNTHHKMEKCEEEEVDVGEQVSNDDVRIDENEQHRRRRRRRHKHHKSDDAHDNKEKCEEEEVVVGKPVSDDDAHIDENDQHRGRQRRRHKYHKSDNDRDKMEKSKEEKVVVGEEVSKKAVVPFSSEGTSTSGSGKAADFFATLPLELSLAEEKLRDSVLDFLREWGSRAEDGKLATVIHVGGDEHVRTCAVDVFPCHIPLKLWIRHRLAADVKICGQNLKLIAEEID